MFYGGVTATGGGLLRKQMADAGMAKTPYIGGDGISDEEYLKIAGSMADNSYYTVAAPDVGMASAQAFNKAYQARFKQAPGAYSAAAYSAAWVIINAIAKAPKERQRHARRRSQEHPEHEEYGLAGRAGCVRQERRHDQRRDQLLQDLRHSTEGEVPQHSQHRDTLG